MLSSSYPQGSLSEATAIAAGISLNLGTRYRPRLSEQKRWGGLSRGFSGPHLWMPTRTSNHLSWVVHLPGDRSGSREPLRARPLKRVPGLWRPWALASASFRRCILLLSPPWHMVIYFPTASPPPPANFHCGKMHIKYHLPFTTYPFSGFQYIPSDHNRHSSPKQFSSS